MKRRVLIVLLLGAIIGSGCLHTGGSNDPNPGSDDPSKALDIGYETVHTDYNLNVDEDEAEIELSIENVGDGEATITDVDIRGPLWVNSHMDDLGFPFGGGDTPILEAPRPAYDLPGQSYSHTFNIPLPDDVNGEQMFELELVVQYDYTMQSRTELTLMREDEFYEQDRTQSQMRTDVDAGPISLTFDGNTPIPDGNDALLPIKIRNQGSGELYDEEVTIDDVRLESYGYSFDACESTLTVVNGERTFECSFEDTIDDIVDGDTESVFELDLNLLADYTFSYEERQHTQVRVIGE